MTEETLKFCHKCQLSKPLTDFYPKRRSTYIDYSAICKICTNDLKKQKNKQLKEIKLANKSVDINYKEVRGGIGDLAEDKFKLACEMVKNGCSVSKLSRFIDCCPITAKKYVDMGLFNK